jgi:hypothetical protein
LLHRLLQRPFGPLCSAFCRTVEARIGDMQVMLDGDPFRIADPRTGDVQAMFRSQT